MIFAGIILLIGLAAFLFYASYSIQAGIYLKAFCRKNTEEKIVALTFDDGPHPLQTSKVLDVLKERNLPATFFCIGKQIKGNENILHRMINEGHSLGNHSYIHSWRFPFFTGTSMTEDLKRWEHSIAGITSERIKWFRPPYGVTNPTIAKVAKRLNYITIGWNIRTLDTQITSHEKILRRIKKKTQTRFHYPTS